MSHRAWAFILIASLALIGTLELWSKVTAVIEFATSIYGLLGSPTCSSAPQICVILAELKAAEAVISSGFVKLLFGLRLAAIPVVVAVLLNASRGVQLGRWWARVSFYVFGAIATVLLGFGVTLRDLALDLPTIAVAAAQCCATGFFLYHLDRLPEAET